MGPFENEYCRWLTFDNDILDLISDPFISQVYVSQTHSILPFYSFLIAKTTG